ncbi:MAG: hypothetical protein KAS25_03425, partial [Dehalococcoidales bacterium]|nr:hypothetical protein [Dehalococcoidales bacterium]
CSWLYRDTATVNSRKIAITNIGFDKAAGKSCSEESNPDNLSPITRTAPDSTYPILGVCHYPITSLNRLTDCVV